MGVLWERQAPRAAYVHVPFCRRRCFYCDFPISVVGDRLVGESSGMMAEYVAALIREIELEPDRGATLQTVFFGGGTPSLLSPHQIGQILNALQQQFGFAPEIEISMEVDPGTFDHDRLQAWLEFGVNRLSLGVQTFQDELLAVCGRSHREADIWQSVELLRSAAVKNWSLDLMSGLPGQTLAMWSQSLDYAVSVGSTHLSVYDLTVEPETVFGKRDQRGQLGLPVEEAVVEMYRSTALVLASAGFERYEVSSYTRDRAFECRHNRVYWEGLPFYGFGMGATSFVDGVRFGRARTRVAYFDWVNQKERSDRRSAVNALDPNALNANALNANALNANALNASASDNRALDPSASNNRALSTKDPDFIALHDREIFLERVMMGLRLVKGIELAQLEARFGEALVQEAIDVLGPFVDSGWVSIESGWLRLSNPEGLLMSNVVLVKLFEVMER